MKNIYLAMLCTLCFCTACTTDTSPVTCPIGSDSEQRTKEEVTPETRRVLLDTTYTATVGSKKIEGVVFSCGNESVAMLLAVKTKTSPNWFGLSGIAGFEYVAGFEYMVELREQLIHDQDMGDPQWTEYSLVRLISKKEATSIDLPDSFIPKQ